MMKHLIALLIGCIFFLAARPAHACPGCPPTQPTLAEELASLDVAVLAVEVGSKRPAPNGKLTIDVNEQSTFRIIKVLKGTGHLGQTREATALYFGREPAGTVFYLTAHKSPKLTWNTPMALSKRAVAYLETIIALPEDRAARLPALLKYLEDEDPLIAIDAYNEFAVSPYEALQKLKSRLDRQQLRRWIADDRVSRNHRQLYLTMLGICGNQDDAALLEEMIRSPDRDGALSSLIASYLVLRGSAGLPLIEEVFLKSSSHDIGAAVHGLRITEQVSDRIPRRRLAESLRHVLSRPDVAHLVIPDLARWQDWGAMDQLVQLFHQAPPEAQDAVRVAVLRFLLACPLPAAKTHREKLAALDPRAMKRANFLPLGSAPPAEE